MTTTEPIPPFEQVRELRALEKIEVRRLALAGVFAHDSELVYADGVESFMVGVCGPNWRGMMEQSFALADRAVEEWNSLIPCTTCHETGLSEHESCYTLCPTCHGERRIRTEVS